MVKITMVITMEHCLIMVKIVMELAMEQSLIIIITMQWGMQKTIIIWRNCPHQYLEVGSIGDAKKYVKRKPEQGKPTKKQRNNTALMPVTMKHIKIMHISNTSQIMTLKSTHMNMQCNLMHPTSQMLQTQQRNIKQNKKNTSQKLQTQQSSIQRHMTRKKKEMPVIMRSYIHT